jgi:RepB DNA-primase from phage plasmid
MTIEVDEATIREFLTTISEHVVKLANGVARPGVLQICVLSPVDEKLVPHRFCLDAVEEMVKTAIEAAKAGLNVYLEARTVRPDLHGTERGKIADTAFVFGLVVDSDADKGKAGVIGVRPSLAIETSSGNFHYWFLLTQPGAATRMKLVGDSMRAATGADADTGVITQCYRVPGTPNYPSKAKQGRGRTAVERTRLVEQTGRVWESDELLAAFASAQPTPVVAAAIATTAIDADEASLPDDLLKKIREGGVSKGAGKKADVSRSGLFHHVIGNLKKRHWTVERINALLERYPNGVAAKYQGRLLAEIQRAFDRVDDTVSSPTGLATPIMPGVSVGGSGGGSAPPPPPPPLPPSPPPPGGAATPQSASSHVLPTIRLRDGQLPRTVKETEDAVQRSGAAIFVRAGRLVYPVEETSPAAGGGVTITAKLNEFTVDSFIEPVAEAAIYQRYSMRAKDWTDVDPPIQVVRMVLARERKWSYPHVAGVITTPTLRPDGSLLSVPGYDQRTELYLCLGLSMPPIPQAPTKNEAIAALATLKDLFGEFPFKNRALDLAVILSGLLTAILRGSLPAAPFYLVRGDTPGVGKSYLIDVIATISTGRLCPVITAGHTREETEKRLIAILLAGGSIVSLDNLTHDLSGSLLCQIAERPVVSVRPLGRTDQIICECHTAMFGTGNNVTFGDDMVRRGLTCNLEALDERPELREFKHDPLTLAQAGRGKYVAAALTIVRAYLTAGAPRVCGSFGSYPLWSTMVRSPLVWLGESDPTACLEDIRKDDPVLNNIREFFALWRDYLLMDTPYTTARIIDVADDRALTNFNPPWLKTFLLRVAATKGNERDVSPERLGWWLRKVSGRVVNGLRLVREHDKTTNAATFRLITVT